MSNRAIISNNSVDGFDAHETLSGYRINSSSFRSKDGSSDKKTSAPPRGRLEDTGSGLAREEIPHDDPPPYNAHVLKPSDELPLRLRVTKPNNKELCCAIIGGRKRCSHGAIDGILCGKHIRAKKVTLITDDPKYEHILPRPLCSAMTKQNARCSNTIPEGSQKAYCRVHAPPDELQASRAPVQEHSVLSLPVPPSPPVARIPTTHSSVSVAAEHADSQPEALSEPLTTPSPTLAFKHPRTSEEDIGEEEQTERDDLTSDVELSTTLDSDSSSDGLSITETCSFEVEDVADVDDNTGSDSMTEVEALAPQPLDAGVSSSLGYTLEEAKPVNDFPGAYGGDIITEGPAKFGRGEDISQLYRVLLSFLMIVAAMLFVALHDGSAIHYIDDGDHLFWSLIRKGVQFICKSPEE
ncbi:hypothetical protein SISSUDRAFT_400082 [Sistotremastrum suecicum HHB10207 ss-3]|uniref:Uncharacterized protein n=1 Tax=Sistotremastrum suecicum HHB10207 ss-3 TaxID=1314776 RepID=A0A166FRV9_9AGAM|nr:hypothetical protein SISSUDRAFT_400082 [Sistotremastrum suecicum HHB10207 ss-3]